MVFYPNGTVKINLAPFPSLLSAEIFPPFLSTSSLQSSNPRPEPFSSAVPFVEKCNSLLNSLEISSLLMPVPSSLTEISTNSVIPFT